MKYYFKLEEHVSFNLYPDRRAQVVNCHFEVLPGAKQNIPYFNLLELQEKKLKIWYAKRYSYSLLLLGYYI